MRAEFTVTVDEVLVPVKMTLGALERIAETEPFVVRLQMRLLSSMRQADQINLIDIKTVLEAAAGPIGARQIVEGLGLLEAAAIATRALAMAFVDDDPEPVQPDPSQKKRVKNRSLYGASLLPAE